MFARSPLAAHPDPSLPTSIPAGKDATEEFEEIGHSRAAKEMLGKYYIGEFAVSGTGGRVGGGCGQSASAAQPIRWPPVHQEQQAAGERAGAGPAAAAGTWLRCWAAPLQQLAGVHI